MKARVISHSDHPIGKMFKEFFDCEFFSRRTGFDATVDEQRKVFVDDTEKYDWTINLSRAIPFGGTNLLLDLSKKCHEERIEHKVFNIGSYISFGILHMPNNAYDVEKAALKLTHRKMCSDYLFHNGTLDSRLFSVGYIKEYSNVERDYPHLNAITLEDIFKNIKFMIDNPEVKELSVQYNQPGNHRFNNGVGLILPGVY